MTLQTGFNPDQMTASTTLGRFSQLVVGQHTHTAQFGESMQSIAQEYGLSLAQLLDANPRLAAGGILPGDTINLPAPGNATSMDSGDVSAPELFYHPLMTPVQSPVVSNMGASAPSFDAMVRGQQSQPIDMDLAEISQAVYDPEQTQVGDWTRLDSTELTAAGIDPSQLEDPSTGFRAGIYTDGEGHQVLAFAGTNDRKDAVHDALQGLGLDSAQYRQAAYLAVKAKTAFGDDLAVTGHSLGGGLAATAAVATDTAAVTFNAAGVHDQTLQGVANQDPAAAKAIAEGGQIRAYSVEGEVLSSIQDNRKWILGGLAATGIIPSPISGIGVKGLLNGDLPQALGHRVTLSDPNPVAQPKIQWYEWFMIGGAGVKEAQYAAARAQHSVEKHSMDTVLSAMRMDHPDWSR